MNTALVFVQIARHFDRVKDSQSVIQVFKKGNMVKQGKRFIKFTGLYYSNFPRLKKS